MSTQTVQQPGGEQPPPETTIMPPPKLRRRPIIWALGVALIALGGLLAAWITTSVTDTQAVVAVRADVDRGSVIEKADLTVVHISNDPSLTPLTENELDQVVGKHAARDLTTGSLLSASAVTSEVIPAEGKTLVGVSLTRAQLPATPLQAGDEVRVIHTPRENDSIAKNTRSPLMIEGTVVGTRGLPNTGQVVVDVTVPTQDAEQLTMLVATRRVGLVLDGGVE